jgi:putative ABC transport system substrate-binding protein
MAWPLAVRAQQQVPPEIGFLIGGSHNADSDAYTAALREGLKQAGYVEGRSVAITERWAEGHYDRLPALVADLVGRKVKVILTAGPNAALVAKSAAVTIPIVFIVGGDPVELGLVASLARPGGNLTGVSFLTADLTAKRLELLSELAPRTKVTALLVNPKNPNIERNVADAQAAAGAKGVTLIVVKAGTEKEIDAAFETLARQGAGAVVVAADPFFDGRREQLVSLTAGHAVPAIFALREFTVAGGLVSYGASLVAAYHQAGTYVGRILKGENPTDLPVQQPTKFELVINLKTAKVLGLTVPQSLLAQADEVIE